ncbi:AraC family transcriptional regulator [Leucobacter insecticola]|uniref:AraC family transcriptional regulator n=1 Tax=Leucobacter insecticola TaxID=2714934 RepID=A0A6G8FJ08_9MICO|nr:AraC family transcriptional regulator [Leucobacter insecticola]QIM16269.1 AraC family transcriptional regulator [Leucobacter insecticola]
MHSLTMQPDFPSGTQFTVEPIDALNEAHEPHRHNFAQLILIEEGEGYDVIDFARVPLTPGDVHVIAPGQVHFWEARGLRGIGVMFEESLLDQLGGLPDQVRELLLLGAAPLCLTMQAQAQVRRLVEAVAETRSSESARHLISATMWECVSGGAAPPAAVEQSSLSRDFLRMVLRAPSARMTVSSCAAVLGVTSGYLTESVVADTGSTPGRILRTAVARESQRLLNGTELSAAQIADRLGFSEPSYFSRFFRREVGCTPTSYREVPASTRRMV